MKKYHVFVIALFCVSTIQCKKPQVSGSFTELWQQLQTPYFGEPLDIKFISADTGYILGVEVNHINDSIYNILIKTHDGGQTWQSVAYTSHQFLTDTSSGIMGSIYVSPFNSNIIFSGRNNLLRSADGGLHWQIIDSMSKTSFPVYFFDAANGIGASVWGISSTTDGGIHWNKILPGISINKIQFTGRETGYAGFGAESTGFASGLFAEGMLLKTADGGNSWQQLNYPRIPSYRNEEQAPAITGITFVNDKVGFVSANNDWNTYTGSAIYKTTDGGNNWNIIDSSILPKYGYAQNLYMKNEKEGFFNSELGIFHTADGCQTWQKDHAAGISFMCFPDEHTGYAMDANGNVFKRHF